MTSHNNHLHDHSTDDEALEALMIEACQKYLIDNFDWKNRIGEVLDRVSSKSLENALAEFKTGSSLTLSVLLDEEAERIMEDRAKYLVKRYGKEWLSGLNGEIEE